MADREFKVEERDGQKHLIEKRSWSDTDHGVLQEGQGTERHTINVFGESYTVDNAGFFSNDLTIKGDRGTGGTLEKDFWTGRWKLKPDEEAIANAQLDDEIERLNDELRELVEPKIESAERRKDKLRARIIEWKETIDFAEKTISDVMRKKNGGKDFETDEMLRLREFGKKVEELKKDRLRYMEEVINLSKGQARDAKTAELDLWEIIGREAYAKIGPETRAYERELRKARGETLSGDRHGHRIPGSQFIKFVIAVALIILSVIIYRKIRDEIYYYRLYKEMERVGHCSIEKNENEAVQKVGLDAKDARKSKERQKFGSIVPKKEFIAGRLAGKESWKEFPKLKPQIANANICRSRVYATQKRMG